MNTIQQPSGQPVPLSGGLPAPSPKAGDAAQPATSSVVNAFAALDRARDWLAKTAATNHEHQKALRRFARERGCGLKEARRQQYLVDPGAAGLRERAKRAHVNALSEFRRVALIAALERIVDADRRRAVA